MRIYCPTEKFEVRDDKWGDGDFGTPRGTLPGGAMKYHDGLDLVVEPGAPIYAMIDGMVEKIDYPYRDMKYAGLQMSNHLCRVEIWYMAPFAPLVGQFIQAGTHIGYAQDISKKYGEDEEKGVMTPHVHVRVSLLPFTSISNNKYVSYGQFINPKLLIGE